MRIVIAASTANTHRDYHPLPCRLARLLSVVGERGKWSGERRGAFSRAKPERNARRRAADGSYSASRFMPHGLRFGAVWLVARLSPMRH